MNSFFMYSELKALHTNLICFQAERNNALSFTFKNPSHPSMTLHRGVNLDKWCPSRIQIGHLQMKLGQSSSSRHGSRSSLTIHTRGTAGPPMVLANWMPKSIFGVATWAIQIAALQMANSETMNKTETEIRHWIKRISEMKIAREEKLLPRHNAAEGQQSLKLMQTNT